MEQTNREILKRIAALLFALAELADRASLAPLPVRALVLAILRPAEAIARAFVFGTARDLGVTIPPQASLDGGAADEATRLAYRLRILALVLANLSALAEYTTSRSCHRIVATVLLCGPGQRIERQSTSIPDTS